MKTRRERLLLVLFAVLFIYAVTIKDNISDALTSYVVASTDCIHRGGTTYETSSEGHWTICKNCGEAKMTTKNGRVEGIGAHKWKNKNGQCSVCKFTHTHEVEWTTTADKHTGVCKVCEYKVASNKKHTFVNGTCTTCEYKVTAETCIHKGGKTWETSEEGHYTLCVNCGETKITKKNGKEVGVAPHKFNKKGLCTVCKYQQEICSHEGGEKYISDTTHHWVMCKNCNQVEMYYHGSTSVGKASHSFYEGICSQCGFDKKQDPNHKTHKGITLEEYRKDATAHWTICECGIEITKMGGSTVGKGSHTFAQGICTMCGYVDSTANVERYVEVEFKCGEGGKTSVPYEVREFKAGTSRDITVTPDEGYEIASITVNGVEQEITDKNGMKITLTFTESGVVEFKFAEETKLEEPKVEDSKVECAHEGGNVWQQNETHHWVMCKNCNEVKMYYPGSKDEGMASHSFVQGRCMQCDYVTTENVDRNVKVEFKCGEGGKTNIPYTVREFKAGTSRDVTVTPDEGYEIASITVNGVEQEITDKNGMKTTLTFTENSVVEFKFAQKDEEELTAWTFAIVDHIYDVVEDDNDEDVFIQKLRLIMMDGTTNREYKIVLKNDTSSAGVKVGDVIAFRADENNHIDLDNVKPADKVEGYNVIKVNKNGSAEVDRDSKRIIVKNTIYKVTADTTIVNKVTKDSMIFKEVVNENNAITVDMLLIVKEGETQIESIIALTEPEILNSDLKWGLVTIAEMFRNKTGWTACVLGVDGEEYEYEYEGSLRDNTLISYTVSGNKMTIKSKVDLAGISGLDDDDLIQVETITASKGAFRVESVDSDYFTYTDDEDVKNLLKNRIVEVNEEKLIVVKNVYDYDGIGTLEVAEFDEETLKDEIVLAFNTDEDETDIELIVIVNGSGSSRLPQKEEKLGEIAITLMWDSNLLERKLEMDKLATIDWGDGVVEKNSDGDHTYSKSGIYTVKIYGDVTVLDCSNNNLIQLDIKSDKLKNLNCSNNNFDGENGLCIESNSIEEIICENNKAPIVMNIDDCPNLRELKCPIVILK